MGLAEIRSAGMTALRRARTAIGGTAVVLAYHRFASDLLDPQRLNVAPERLEEHVRVLAERYRLMTAGDLFAALAQRRRLPDRAVVVTIDDGYADSLTVGAPVFERYEVPATLFVSSGCLGREHGFWWDDLERLLLHPGLLPERLEVRAGPVAFEESFVAGDRELTRAGAAEFRGWDFTQAVSDTRQRLYLRLSGLLNPLTGPQRDDALGQLRGQISVEEGWSGAPASEVKRPLTPAEVVQLQSGGLVEIGAHTATHLVLAHHPIETQRAEIVEDKRALEDLCGRPIRSFAYPHGGSDDYSAESVECARDAGFLGACTTRLGALLPWGSVGRGTDRFQVPRTTVPDVSATELEALIDKRLGL